MKLSYQVRKDIEAAFRQFRAQNPYDPGRGSLEDYLLIVWTTAVHTGMNMQRKRTEAVEAGEGVARTVITYRKTRRI